MVGLPAPSGEAWAGRKGRAKQLLWEGHCPTEQAQEQGLDTAQLNRLKSRVLEPPCQMAGGEGDLVGRGPSGEQLLTY